MVIKPCKQLLSYPCKAQCHTRGIKVYEQCKSIVTIMDTATQPPLDCALLLHGGKLPELSCMALLAVYH